MNISKAVKSGKSFEVKVLNVKITSGDINNTDYVYLITTDKGLFVGYEADWHMFMFLGCDTTECSAVVKATVVNDKHTLVSPIKGDMINRVYNLNK